MLSAPNFVVRAALYLLLSFIFFIWQACKFANTTRRGGVLAWVMGCSLFFSTAASLLLLGISLRPIMDKVSM